DDPRKIEAGFLVQPNQLPIQSQRRGTGGQAQYGSAPGGIVLADQALDHEGHVPGGLGAGRKHEGGNLGVRYVVGRHLSGQWLVVSGQWQRAEEPGSSEANCPVSLPQCTMNSVAWLLTTDHEPLTTDHYASHHD